MTWGIGKDDLSGNHRRARGLNNRQPTRCFNRHGMLGVAVAALADPKLVHAVVNRLRPQAGRGRGSAGLHPQRTRGSAIACPDQATCRGTEGKTPCNTHGGLAMRVARPSRRRS